MATQTISEESTDSHVLNSIESIALDIQGLLTCAQSMQENIWDWMETSGRADCSSSFNDALIVTLGLIREKANQLQEVAIND
tara:strand:+ start:197 stop:442 length:246 start_codon:yes stop_codon:yes gene_type:complete